MKDVDKSKEQLLKENKKILIAEDEDYCAIYIKKILEIAGYTTEVALNGNEAVSKYKEVSDFDLIIMDLRMPIMDGFQATKEIRRIEKTKGSKNIPIIALTAAIMENIQEHSIVAGCNAFLLKPVTQADLLKIVARYLKKRIK